MFNTSQSKKGLGQEAKNKEREQGMQGTGGRFWFLLFAHALYLRFVL